MFVPFQGKKWALGPCRILGLASQINTNGNLLRIPHNHSMVVRVWCPPPSTVVSSSLYRGHLCARSVGPFSPPKQDKGGQPIIFPPPRLTVSRAAWNLFVFHNDSVQIRLANNFPFGSFQCSLEGVETCPSSRHWELGSTSAALCARAGHGGHPRQMETRGCRPMTLCEP